MRGPLVTKLKQNDTILQGFHIIITGFNEKDYIRVAKLAVLLGAIVETVCSPRVTCLITRYMGATHCIEAINLHIPIITVPFLQDVQSHEKLLPLENYLAPPFYRLTICCTGLSASQRRDCQHHVELLGGKWKNDLEQNVTTHLIACEAKGAKYEHARSWGTVHIVTMQWIEACAKQKQWLPEEKYYLTHPSSSSNMTTSEVVVVDEGAKLKHTVVVVEDSQSMEVDDSSLISYNHIQREEVNSSSSSSSSSKAKLSFLQVVEEVEHVLVDRLSIHSLPPIEAILPHQRLALAGSGVFIQGYSKPWRDYVVKLVLHTGGHVHPFLSQTTAYVILGPQLSEKMRQELSQHPCDLEQIGVLWFLEHFFPPASWEDTISQALAMVK
eukprot:gene3639-3984_t